MSLAVDQRPQAAAAATEPGAICLGCGAAFAKPQVYSNHQRSNPKCKDATLLAYAAERACRDADRRGYTCVRCSAPFVMALDLVHHLRDSPRCAAAIKVPDTIIAPRHNPFLVKRDAPPQADDLSSSTDSASQQQRPVPTPTKKRPAAAEAAEPRSKKKARVAEAHDAVRDPAFPPLTLTAAAPAAPAAVAVDLLPSPRAKSIAIANPPDAVARLARDVRIGNAASVHHWLAETVAAMAAAAKALPATAPGARITATDLSALDTLAQAYAKAAHRLATAQGRLQARCDVEAASVSDRLSLTALTTARANAVKEFDARLREIDAWAAAGAPPVTPDAFRERNPLCFTPFAAFDALNACFHRLAHGSHGVTYDALTHSVAAIGPLVAPAVEAAMAHATSAFAFITTVHATAMRLAPPHAVVYIDSALAQLLDADRHTPDAVVDGLLSAAIEFAPSLPVDAMVVDE